MKANKKIILGIAIGAVTLAVVAVFVFWRSDYLQRWRERKFLALWKEGIEDAQSRRALLLCKTDHQVLLKAGREILRQLPEDYLNTGGDRFAGVMHLPKEIQIPKAIRDIRPRGIFVDYDGYLMLEMHGGMDHFGVQIYPEDYEKPDRYFKYGDRELLPGLWYYDDGYLHNPEYDKRIDELIAEHKDKGNK